MFFHREREPPPHPLKAPQQTAERRKNVMGRGGGSSSARLRVRPPTLRSDHPARTSLGCSSLRSGGPATCHFVRGRSLRDSYVAPPCMARASPCIPHYTTAPVRTSLGLPLRLASGHMLVPRMCPQSLMLGQADPASSLDPEGVCLMMKRDSYRAGDCTVLVRRSSCDLSHCL